MPEAHCFWHLSGEIDAWALLSTFLPKQPVAFWTQTQASCYVEGLSFLSDFRINHPLGKWPPSRTGCPGAHRAEAEAQGGQAP